MRSRSNVKTLLVRGSFVVLNLIIISGGAVLIAFGAKYSDLHEPIFGEFSFQGLTLSMGSLAIAVSIFGCVALFFKKQILFKIYSGIFMLLFVTQLSLGIMANTETQVSIFHGFSEDAQDFIDVIGKAAIIFSVFELLAALFALTFNFEEWRKERSTSQENLAQNYY